MAKEIHVEDDKARSGVTRHNVRYVLAISLALIVLVFAAVLIWGDAMSPTHPTREATLSKGEVRN